MEEVTRTVCKYIEKATSIPVSYSTAKIDPDYETYVRVYFSGYRKEITRSNFEQINEKIIVNLFDTSDNLYLIDTKFDELRRALENTRLLSSHYEIRLREFNVFDIMPFMAKKRKYMRQKSITIPVEIETRTM